jgi:hypothetical protein
MDATRAEQLAAMDVSALVAELRTLSDAGSSFDQQAECCFYLRDAVPLPTGAAAEDAVRAVVAALTRGVNHVMLQLAGCVALGTLINAAPATAAAAGTAGVTAVLAALRTHSGNADVPSVAFTTLSQLVGSDATNRTTAGAEDGVAMVVVAMTKCPCDECVATRGCEALGSLTQNHPRNAAAALDAGAVKAVLAAMRAFSAAVHLQSWGCWALFNISRAAGARALGGTLADGAAADAVVTAMRAHAGEREVQRHGCDLLSCIFRRGDPKTDGSWARRGTAALAVVVAALKAHREDVDLLREGCATISTLMSSIDGNRHAAAASGAIEAVVVALRAFPAAAHLQVGGLGALCIMCLRVRNNQLAAAAVGGLDAAIGALRTLTTDATVQYCAVCALGAMVDHAPPNQTRAGRYRGVVVDAAGVRCAASCGLRPIL